MLLCVALFFIYLFYERRGTDVGVVWDAKQFK